MGTMNIAQKLKDNITAIRICLENDGKKLSSQQIEQVAKFSGWGMCKAVLYDQASWENASIEDKKLRPLIDELHKLLQEELTGRDYKKVVESMKNAVLTSFYTPKIIPATFYEVLKKYHRTSMIYEPSAGMGVFVTEAIEPLKNGITNLQHCELYEKDLLTGKVLQALMNSIECYPSIVVNNNPFEESSSREDDEFDVVVSNIPFGAFSVYDPSIEDVDIKKKIHNYFFAKGLTKLKEGGILAYVVTSAFLDTVTNRSAREYLFNKCDFISCICMPDNLMKETGNTEAPSHFLVVRKNSSKTELSAEEQLLCISENKEYYYQSVVSRNRYIDYNKDYITIGETKIGKNQYGKPSVEVHWDKPIHEIEEEFRTILQRDFAKRYNKPKALYEQMTEFRQEQREQNIKAIADEMPPWEEPDFTGLQEVLDKMVDEIHEELSEDTTDGITDDYEEGTCISCGAEMQSVGEQCGNCLEEEAKRAVLHDFQNASKRFGQIEYTEISQQTEPVKKELSKRDREVLNDYYKIRDAFKTLEQNK